MYSKGFYIEENIWNNALSFLSREKFTWNKSKLFVPSLIKLQEQSSTKITFQDFWFDEKLSTHWGLENFYETTPSPSLVRRGITAPIYLFDNHNHALYFWYLAKHNWIIQENSTLYHVDEHADYRDAQETIEKTDLHSIFNYTNFSKINVGNYIIPAEKEGLIWKTIQIRNTQNLEDYLNSPSLAMRGQGGGIILNLDLDFFQPDLDFMDYELKKKVVRDIASKADVITVATSPFFIDQKLALEVFEDLFYK